MSSSTAPPGSKAIQPVIFFGSLAILASVCAYLVLDPERGNALVSRAFGFLTGPMGWSYEWFVMFMVGLMIYLAFGPMGRVRMGEDAPEFKTLPWLGMLFTSAVGSSITYWGSIEFFYYYQSPPFGAEPFSVEAAQWASAYGYFHWTVANAIYVVMGVIFGFIFYIKKKDVLRPSEACRPILGARVDGPLGKIIDIFFVLGLIAGIATTLGLGTSLVSQIIHQLFGVEHNLGLDIVVVVLWTGLIALTVYFGLHKGLLLASNIRVWLTFILLGFVFIVGPTAFMLNNFTESIGTMAQNFFRMSFYTDPHGKSGFPQGWTIFYWAWWVAFSIQMGIYIARISRGRTVREILIGGMASISCGCWLFFMILGNYSMHVFQTGQVPLVEIMAQPNGAPQAIATIWGTLPLGGLMMFLFMFVTFLGAGTSLSSSGFTLAVVTTAKITGHEEPAKWNRVFWCLALGAAAITLMALGGLKPLQTASIVGSFPLMFIIAIIVAGFFKEIKTTDMEKFKSR